MWSRYTFHALYGYFFWQVHEYVRVFPEEPGHLEGTFRPVPLDFDVSLGRGLGLLQKCVGQGPNHSG